MILSPDYQHHVDQTGTMSTLSCLNVKTTCIHISVSTAKHLNNMKMAESLQTGEPTSGEPDKAS